MTKAQEKTERNLEVMKKRAEGWSYSRIGSFFNSSRQNIMRIVKNFERDNPKVKVGEDNKPNDKLKNN